MPEVHGVRRVQVCLTQHVGQGSGLLAGTRQHLTLRLCAVLLGVRVAPPADSSVTRMLVPPDVDRVHGVRGWATVLPDSPLTLSRSERYSSFYS